MPIKRCCHAYGQELTGRSQHGHGSTLAARTFTHTCVPPRKRSADSCRRRRNQEVVDRHTLIGEHLDLSGRTGNYRTGLPITVHPQLHVHAPPRERSARCTGCFIKYLVWMYLRDFVGFFVDGCEDQVVTVIPLGGCRRRAREF